MRMRQWIIVALMALLALPVAAQDDELKTEPGYVDFGSLESVYGEPKVMVNIGAMLLAFMGQAADSHDPEVAEFMRELKGVRINIYSTEGQVAPAMDQVAKVKSMLRAQSWEQVVQVQEDDEQVQIYMKGGAEGMQGLTVMAVDDEEAVFLNILGNIDPSKVGTLMEQFDIDLPQP